ncbi:molybdopterin-guanine dinucleotide biosynthesis protein MobA [Gimesia fumaroli]|jgi:CTP:molybdopterin cytidylyltransferase MocA|uniref:Molybdopterin-guanine dinucleotide biosynthesis protein MobA n=2 Tax=Gimesia fumaroli TaxID=2527976 RepID=A0A518IFY9_9PLAN|nr:molybdopterin-guanine dinucleotide biosynthesis protein MobA [Gimesia fumaroli]
MGTHKLLLTLGKETVIQRLVHGLSAPFITRIVIVTRKDDERLKDHLSDMDLDLIQPEVDPPDMKQSVQIGLEWIEAHYQPEEQDSWLLIPADHPVLKREVLEVLYQAWEQCEADVMVPTFQNQKGHPAFFRWSVSRDVFALQNDEGINALWKNHGIQPKLFECDFPEILIDLDTPADFESVQQQFSEDF